MNLSSKSCAVPVAIGIAVLGLFLFLTRKINTAFFASFLLCAGLVLLLSSLLEGVGQQFETVATSNSKTAEIVGQASSSLLAASQQKTHHLKLQFWTNLVSFAGALIGFGTVALTFLLHLHGH